MPELLLVVGLMRQRCFALERWPPQTFRLDSAFPYPQRTARRNRADSLPGSAPARRGSASQKFRDVIGIQLSPPHPPRQSDDRRRPDDAWPVRRCRPMEIHRPDSGIVRREPETAFLTVPDREAEVTNQPAQVFRK